jgi:predicted metal-dependent peptidase
MEEMAAEWVMNTMQAARITEKYGSLPGNIKSQVKDMQPTTPWRAVLRQFVDSTATTRSNWARPDRRFAGRGLHLPTKAGKRLKSLIIALDTSGSLLDQQAELLAEVSAALHQYPIDKVHVLHVDSQLRHVDVFSKGDVLRVEESYGGGGTDLRIPFDYADNAEENFHGIIYITDLEGPQPDDSEHRTLWLCTSPPSRAEYYLPKFGEVAYMRD